MANASTSPPLPADFQVPLLGAQAIASGAITGSVATIAVVARLYTKIRITKAVGWDDYFSVIALVFALARVVTECIMVAVYGGRSAVVVPLSDLNSSVSHVTSLDISIEVLYLCAVLFAKLSILALYIIVFGRANRVFRWTCHVVTATTLSYCLTCIPLYVFSCLPSGARNLGQLAAGQCVPTVPLSLAVGALNIVTDTILIILPIPPVLKLQVTRRRRLALIVAFGTGSIAWAASVGREWLFLKSLNSSNAIRTEIYDILWLTTEMNVGIVAGCLPVLQPLFQRIGSYLSHVHSSIRENVSRSRRIRSITLFHSVFKESNSDFERGFSQESVGKTSSSTLNEASYPLQPIPIGYEQGNHVIPTL